MRVLQVVPYVGNEASGPTYSVVRLAQSLSNLGEDVLLMTVKDGQLPNQERFQHRVYTKAKVPGALWRSPALLNNLRKEALQSDLIHSHGMWVMPSVYPGWVANKIDIPLIVSPRGSLSNWAMGNGSPMKRLFWPLVQRPAWKATTCFHATAESEYQDIRRMGFRQPVAIIPNGVDIPKCPPKKPGRIRTLLFLGRIYRVKGLDMLLPAWGLIQNRYPDWQLKVIGPDNDGYLPQMQQLAAELGLKRIYFTDAIFGQAKWQVYRDADLYVLPTYSENFGVTVAEALASGIPAIVTQGAPWAGLMKHRAGWWVETSVDALAESLEDALSRSRSELDAMGMRGREWMAADFGWQALTKRMSDVYYWILESRHNECTPPEFVKVN